MKSIQDYRSIYREIASNLGIQGDSVELLIQLLAQHSYINEVENISYLRESSMDTSVMLNSKIQHCIDDMYSVFRGTCPRVVLNFTPLKEFSFHVYDEIMTSNNFSLYYLGYYDEDKIIYDDLSIYPEYTAERTDNLATYKIIALLSPEKITRKWTTDYLNLYYVDCTEEDLSNDVYLLNENTSLPVTRDFAEHIVKNCVFDLTLPSFGSRLYIADSGLNSKEGEEAAEENITLTANYFRYTTVASLNQNELNKISVAGMDLKNPEDSDESWNKGVKIIYEIPRDTAYSLHYKASKDKFISTMIRSNDDITRLFKETFIGYTSTNGVTYVYEELTNTITIKYILASEDIEDISNQQKTEFINNARAYYISDQIIPVRIDPIPIKLNLELVLYDNVDSSSLDSSLKEIVDQYSRSFGIDLKDDNIINEIRSKVEKISCIRYVKTCEFQSIPIPDDKVYVITPTYSIVK